MNKNTKTMARTGAGSQPVDHAPFVRGEIAMHLVPGGVEFHSGHNSLSPRAARALAHAYAGDTSYIPAGMGFLCADAGIEVDSIVGSAESWGDVLNAFKDMAGVAVADYRLSGRASVEEPESDPGSSIVKFNAVTSNLEGGIVVRKVFLLGADGSILATGEIGNKAKPDGYELSLDWRVVFGGVSQPE